MLIFPYWNIYYHICIYCFDQEHLGFSKERVLFEQANRTGNSHMLIYKNMNHFNIVWIYKEFDVDPVQTFHSFILFSYLFEFFI